MRFYKVCISVAYEGDMEVSYWLKKENAEKQVEQLKIDHASMLGVEGGYSVIMIKTGTED